MEPICVESAGTRDGELPRMDDQGVYRRLGGRLAQQLPSAVFRLSFQGQGRRPLRLIPARRDEDPVRRRPELMEHQFEINFRASTEDAGVILVGQESPVRKRKLFSVPEQLHPGGRSFRDQAVGDQLRRLVVIGTGRMPGGAQQRDVPVTAVVLLENRREILVRITRIDADSQGPGAFFVSRTSRQGQQCQEGKTLSHGCLISDSCQSNGSASPPRVPSGGRRERCAGSSQ